MKPYRPPNIVRKPVIYLYPENPMDISVQVNLKESKFSTVYPKFNKENIWNGHAKPNGDIIISNKTYPYIIYGQYYMILNIKIIHFFFIFNIYVLLDFLWKPRGFYYSFP